MPVFESAASSLQAVTARHMTELKSYANPPRAVMPVVKAVATLMGLKQDWTSIKHLLSRANLLQELLNYDKDNVSPATIKKIQPFLVEDCFTVEKQAKVCIASKGLCAWVIAINDYHKLSQILTARRAEVEAATLHLATLQQQ